MSLTIKNAEVERLARALAALTGESLTDAVKRALNERLDRVQKRSRDSRERQLRDLEALSRYAAALAGQDAQMRSAGAPAGPIEGGFDGW